MLNVQLTSPSFTVAWRVDVVERAVATNMLSGQPTVDSLPVSGFYLCPITPNHEKLAVNEMLQRVSDSLVGRYNNTRTGKAFNSS